MANTFDVWLVKGDTVYKGVPYGVVTDWAEQGRIGPDDKVRPSGVTSGWVRAADHPLVGDFLFATKTVADVPADLAAQLQAVEMDVGWGKPREDEDDEVDMIPLIDISLVLLIFFMMTATVSALSPIPVPEMKNAAELRTDAEAFTVQIDKRGTGEVVYALRVGSRDPRPEDNNLPGPKELIARLQARLAENSRPDRLPEVRIACNKELPRSHVRDVAKELSALKDKKLIDSYGAEVNEAK